MNYIKQLQADKAEVLDAARSIETAINHLISYLSCPKFHVDTMRAPPILAGRNRRQTLPPNQASAKFLIRLQ